MIQSTHVNVPEAATGVDVVEASVRLPRWVAAGEVILVSGVPTQILVAGVLVTLAGFELPFNGRPLSLAFVAALSALDTLLVVSLMGVFLRLSRERARDVFVGPRPWARDAVRGLALVPVAFIGVGTIVAGLRAVAPWTHNVATNPLEAFINTPNDAALFLVVAVVAGGVREELQRAFVLHRFGQHLGGVRVGLVCFTLLFGALHADQGIDIAVAVGCLGLCWGVVYVRHRSAVLPMVNHAAFNAVQVVQAFIVRASAG